MTDETFVLDLTEEHAGEFIRDVQIAMPRGHGVKQFNLTCRYRHGTQDDIDRASGNLQASGDIAFMEKMLLGWEPDLKVLIEDEDGRREPRLLTAREDLDENRRLLLAIPWLRVPILQRWFNAMVGGTAGERKAKN